MTTCPSCGQDNPDGFRLCGMCGTALAPAPAREQRKTVTIVFCDVTGSTALGERLDPESLRRVMARYFAAMSAAVERHGGTVEKFIGDAVMAVFGIPATHEDDALRAVRAAAEMRDGLGALNEELERDYGTRLAARIGVNTGEVVTGTSERLATGDAVNVAARLEQAAEPGQVLLGSETYGLVRGAATVEPVGPLALKGKAEGVPAFRLVSVEARTPQRRMDSPLVGRERELRALRDAWERASSTRSCHLFTLLGTAGVGKSRLVAEFLRDVEGTVVGGRCLSYGEGITYWPLVEVVKQVIGPAPERLSELLGDPRAEAAIAAVLRESDALTTSEEIAWAGRKLLEAAAREAPLVVVFDDIHWGEPTFLDLVDTIADLSRDAPILLLCMARPELLDRRPGWAGGKLGATTVLLEPLSASETEELLDSLLAEAPLPEELRERVRTTADGNPLFVEEMAAMLRERGGDVGIPPTIHALLAARLDLLDPDERSVLERGSVEGQSFHRGAVQALGPGDDVDRRLVGLVRKELVRPERAVLPGDDAYRFRHLLIRDAAYDALPKATRADLHERFAAWLDAHGQTLVERDEIVGYHLEQALRYRRELGPVDDGALAAAVAARLGAAGRRAFDLGDNAGAVKLLERSVAARAGDAELQLVLSRALFDAGRGADAVARSEQAAAQAHDRAMQLRAEIQRVFYLSNVDPQGRIDELRALVERARPELETTGDDLALATLWQAIGWIHHNDCTFVGQLESFERAAEHARRGGDTRLAIEMLHFAAAGVCEGPTPVPDAIAWLEAHRTDIDPWFDIWRAHMLAELGRFDESDALAREVTAHMRERGMFLALALMVQNHWEVEQRRGDHAAAARAARQGLDDLVAQEQFGWASTAAAMLAISLAELGRHEEAEQMARQGVEMGGDDDVYTLQLADAALAKVAAARGDAARALELAQRALARSEAMESPHNLGDSCMLLAEVLSAGGRYPEAAAAADRALGIYEAKGSLVASRLAREAIARYAAAAP